MDIMACVSRQIKPHDVVAETRRPEMGGWAKGSRKNRFPELASGFRSDFCASPKSDAMFPAYHDSGFPG